MTYDFHGKWESRTGHNSPLYPRDDEQGSARHLNMVCRLCLSNISGKLDFVKFTDTTCDREELNTEILPSICHSWHIRNRIILIERMCLFLTQSSFNPIFNWHIQEFASNYWVQNGAPRQKLNVGLPLYGRSFTLSDKSKSGINAPAVDGGGRAGKYTRENGYLAYYEVLMQKYTVR